MLLIDNVEDKFKAEITSQEENADAPVLSSKTMYMMEDMYKADPTSHLRNLFAPPTNFGGLPPTYFQVCGMDPLRDEGLVYERVLREDHATKTKLEVYPGLPHGFWSWFPDMAASKEVVEDTIEGCEWLLSQA